MEAPVAGLYWNKEYEDVCYVWGVRRDPGFEVQTAHPDAEVSQQRFACHTVAFCFWGSGWGYWAVSQEFHYDLTPEDLAGFERLPVAVPLIGQGPFSTAVRVAMEDVRGLPRVNKETVSRYLSQMPPIGPVRLLQTWWRKTVAEWYESERLPYWIASRLADIRMKDQLRDPLDEEEEEEEDEARDP